MLSSRGLLTFARQPQDESGPDFCCGCFIASQHGSGVASVRAPRSRHGPRGDSATLTPTGAAARTTQPFPRRRIVPSTEGPAVARRAAPLHSGGSAMSQIHVYAGPDNTVPHLAVRSIEPADLWD